jgi:hypothetical protein
MNTNLKIALSAVALAVLAAAPAVAKSRTQSHPAVYSNSVTFDNRVLGADPDAHIRSDLRRDARSFAY